MSNQYNDFVTRYSIRSIHANRDRSFRDCSSYHNTASYYNPYDETVEIEMPRHAFEKLVDYDKYADELHREVKEEKYMRRNHPAIAEAYDKYRMLLELYK